MKNIKPYIIPAIFGVISITIIILQICTINSTTTKLEVALLNILQFIFSIAFSWFLAKITFQSEFIKNQKKFGIAAYRRITEIDKRVSQLIDKIYYKTTNPSKDSKLDLEIFDAMTSSIKQSINSCIADWGDIIGDELDALQTINNLTKEREKLLSDNNTSYDDNNASYVDITNISTINTTVDEYNKKIETLMSSLPDPIKLQIKSDSMDNNIIAVQQRIKSNINKIEKIIQDFGVLELDGFWTYTFANDIRNFQIGDQIKIHVSEDNEVDAFDEDNNIIGRITNSYGVSYNDFSNMLKDYFGDDGITLKLTHIEQQPNMKNKRIAFKGVAIIGTPEELAG